MSEPADVRLIREQKASLLKRERETFRQFVARWRLIEDTLDPTIREAARALIARRERGRVTRRVLQEEATYIYLLYLLGQQVGSFAESAAGSIRFETWQMARLGAVEGIEALRTLDPDLSFVPPSPDGAVQLIETVEREHPIRTMLLESTVEAADRLTSALLLGLGLGLALGGLVREMWRGLSGGLQAALTISADQGFRAYRLGTDYAYSESGVVKFKQRIASHVNPCLACLARDGEILPLDSPTYDHIRGRCTWRGLPPGHDYRDYPGGERWFRSLAESRQREALGPVRFKAWQDGTLNFHRLAKDRYSRTWGRSLRVAQLSELRVGGEGI